MAMASVFFIRSVSTDSAPVTQPLDQVPAAAPKGPASEEGEAPDQEMTTVITGQMTLAEIERATGVPAAKIAAGLDLPADVSSREPLGRLRQKYPFTIDEVRNIGADRAEVAAIAASAEAAPGAAKEIEQVAGAAGQTESHDEEPQLTRGRGAEDPSGVLITGQMTLREIEMRSGVSARLVADRLGLPRHASLDLPLGKLRKTYRFTMQDLRDIVSDLMTHPRPRN